MMLETARELQHPLGSNPKDGAGDGTWPLLVPEGQPIVVMGHPGRHLLQALADAGPVRLVVPWWQRTLTRLLASTDPRVEVGARPREPAGMLVLAGRARATVVRRDLPDLVTPDGHVCVLEPRVGLRTSPTAERPSGHGTLELQMRAGRIVEANPVLPGTPRQRTTRRRRRAALRSANGVTEPPALLRHSLAEAGIDVDGYRFSVHDHGRYRTNKVIVRLIPPEDGATPLIVKFVRDSVDNLRLETEATMLGDLARLPIARGCVPTLVTSGHHRGRAFVAQTAVEGQRLRDLDEGLAPPSLRSLVGWVVDVAATTAHREPADGSILTWLVERFSTLFGLDDRHVALLLEDSHAVADALGQASLVLQHGDLGTWNVRIAAGDTPFVLDWESGERHGLPLWDLFYLVRSQAVGHARRLGMRDPVTGIESFVLGDSELATLQRRAAASTCAATGVPLSLIPALYRLCWVHRAVKESMRRPRPAPRKGHARLALHVVHMDPARLHHALSPRRAETPRCAS